MDIITCDLETYYDQQYSLSKLTTEEYIRDPRFQVIGVAVKVNAGPAQWFSGPARDTLAFLRQFDWANSALLAQNTMFDGAILSWRCGIRPKRLLDTMSMSRAIHGVNARHSLAALAQRYGVGTKGDEVMRAIGLRRTDFSASALRAYGAYCVMDADLTWEIFRKMIDAGFPTDELKLIDLTLKMFTEPVLELDVPHLVGHLERTVRAKASMLADAGITDRKELMSNNKFADLLRSRGVEPPTKISARTGKEAYAFSKTDQEFMALQEHEDHWVQSLVAARLGNKSTIEETRTQRFIDIGGRGALPIPLRYYGAHTGRWSGIESVNFQNLPSRGPNAKQIKKAVVAPDGYMLIDCDSSQIEARVLAWLAEQDDLVEAFARKDDVYKLTASKIYGVDVAQIDKFQRQVGKVVVLGCGYGVGHVKLQAFLKMQAGVEIPLDEAKRVVDVYRHANHKISQLWKDAQNSIKYMAQGDRLRFGRKGVLGVDPDAPGIILPNGLRIIYNGLRAEEGEKGYEYVYDTRAGPTRLYGGKCVENVTQALARIIVGQQMLEIAKRYRVVLTVHDSVVSCVPEDDVDEARAYIKTCMRWTPDWAEGLPVNCESGVGKSYGNCD
jgi:DNA polymerase I-like protein with 3'-5' exonuclease and polymerase domains